jgi:asparagine synthase (glutamine-hydrolysing)
VETKMIFAASRHLSVDATYISYDELPSLLQLIDSVRNQPDPFDGDMTLFRAVYRAAQRSGVNVVLDGGSGDTALAHEDPLPSLVRRARLAAALDEARRQRQNLKYGPAPLQRVTWEAARLASPDWLKKLNRKRIERSARASSLASSDLAKRLGWHERWQQNLQHTSLEESNFSRPWAYRLHPYVVVGRERYDRVASEFGIEARDPFTDIELLSFLAAVPGPLLDNTGRSKWLLREAVKGFLPTEFIWRKGKEHIGWNFTETLWRQTDVSPCTNLHPLLGEYVEAKALGHFRGGDGPNSSRDLRIQHLNNWLNRN